MRWVRLGGRANRLGAKRAQATSYAPAVYCWLWELLAGIGGYLLLLRTLVVTQNPNFFPSLILLGSIVVPTTVLTFAATGGKRWN